MPVSGLDDATGVRSRASVTPASWAIGDTAMRLLTIGMPYSRCSWSAIGTSRSAAELLLFLHSGMMVNKGSVRTATVKAGRSA